MNMRRKLITRVIATALALLMAVPSSSINVFAATSVTDFTQRVSSESNSTYNDLFHTVASLDNGLTSASYETPSSESSQSADTMPAGDPSSEVPQNPEVTQTPDNPTDSDVTPSPETTPVIPDATPSPVPSSPDATLSPEASPSVEVTISPEVSVSPEAVPSPDVSPSPEALLSPEVSPAGDVTISPTVSSSATDFALTKNDYINLSIAELTSEYDETYGQWRSTIRYKYTIKNDIYDSYSGVRLVLMASNKTYSSTDTEINEDDWVIVYNSGTYTYACNELSGYCDIEQAPYVDPTDSSKVTLQGYKTYMLRAVGISKTDESSTTVLAESALFDASKHSYSEVYDNNTNFKGMTLVDENGNEVKSLELKKGESKLIRAALINKSNEITPLDDDTHPAEGMSLKGDLADSNSWTIDWTIYAYDSDKKDYVPVYRTQKSPYHNQITSPINKTDSINPNIRFEWSKEYILGFSQYITADDVVPGPDGKAYIMVHSRSGYPDAGFHMYGEQYAIIPVTVKDEENTSDNPTIDAPTIYTKDTFTTDIELSTIREAMVNRENTYYGFVTDQTVDVPAKRSIYEFTDFYSEREGMLPEEGDYLQWHRGYRGSLSSFDAEEYSELSINYYGSNRTMYYFPQHLITTSYEERQVDEKIAALLGDGGALNKAFTEYNNGTIGKDKALEAIHTWAVNNVSGTVKGEKSDSNCRLIPLYHTAYSALFINNGYDSKPGSGTCQAFALLFTRLTREFGIPSKVIMGIDAGAHTYNIAEFDDGYWYYVDTSANLFKKDYIEFKRADEMACFASYAFNKNYMSKIKNYLAQSQDIDTYGLLQDGGVVASFSSISAAGEYIIGAIDAYKDNDETIPNFTIVLNKDTNLENFGNSTYPNFDGLDLEFAGYGDYIKYISLDLGGHTLTIPDSKASASEWPMEAYNGEVSLRFASISNGVINIGNNNGVMMFGLPWDDEGCATIKNLTVKGSGILDLGGKTKAENTCNFDAIKQLHVRAGATVDCNIRVANLVLRNGYWEPESKGSTTIIQKDYNNPITFTGDVKAEFLKAYNTSFDAYVNNLSVTKRTDICTVTSFYVKGMMTLSGTSNVYYPINIYTYRNGSKKHSEPRFAISGILNTEKCRDIGVYPISIISKLEGQGDNAIDVFSEGDIIASVPQLTVRYYDHDVSGVRTASFSEKLMDKIINMVVAYGATADYYQGLIYIATPCVNLYSGDASDNLSLVNTFTRWDQAISHINSIGTSARINTYFKLELLDDVNAMGPLSLPQYVAGLIISSGKNAQTDISSLEAEQVEAQSDENQTDDGTKVALRFRGNIEPKSDVVFENVDLIGQSLVNGVYTDGNYANLNAKNNSLTFSNSYVKLAGISTVTGSRLKELNLQNSYIDAVKDISGIDNLIMESSTLKTDAKLSLKNIESNDGNNTLIYGGNTTANGLIISGTVSGSDSSNIDLDESYGSYTRIKRNAITLMPKTLTYLKDGQTLTTDTASLSEEEKNGIQIATVNNASFEWFIGGTDADDRYIPTYKSGSILRYGAMTTGVALLSSVDGEGYDVESLYDTLADAFRRINSLNNRNMYYRIELQGTKDLAYNSIGATSSKLNQGFPAAAKRIEITAAGAMGNNGGEPAEAVLYFKDGMSIASDVALVGVTLKSAALATINTGRFTLTLDNCSLFSMAGDGEECIKAVVGGGKTTASKLILKDTYLNVKNNINNVNAVDIEATELASPRCMLNVGTGMNIADLKIDKNVIVNTWGTTSVGDIDNYGGYLSTVAAVTKLAKDSGSDKAGQISAITPSLTISGYVNNYACPEEEAAGYDPSPLVLMLRNKADLDYIDFETDVAHSLIKKGVLLAKAPIASDESVVLSAENRCIDPATGNANEGTVVKSYGYLAYINGEPNARLSYEDYPEHTVSSNFVSFDAVVNEINTINRKRDYVISVNDNATAPEVTGARALTMPKAACISSLTIKPFEDEDPAEGTSEVKLYHVGGINFTSDVILENVSFCQLVKTSSGYEPADEVSDYPAAVPVNAGGRAMTLKGNVRFNSPINLIGKRGSLTFDDGARIFTYDYGRSSLDNTIYGSVSDFATINVTEDLAVYKYRTKANGGYTGGGLQTNYLLIYGSKNPTLTVEGNLAATNTVMTTGDIEVRDIYDTVTRKFSGSKAEFTNVTISGTEFSYSESDGRISISSDRDYIIKGTLTSTTPYARLVTRQKYNADILKRTPYLDIRGTVLINKIGDNSGEDFGDRIEVELLCSNECFDSDYSADKGIAPEVAGRDSAFELKNSPANTGMVFNTAKGTTGQFIVSAANVADAGRSVDGKAIRYAANDDAGEGYVLKKVGTKVYVYRGDEIQTAVVAGSSDNGRSGRIDNVLDADVIGYYPSLDDAVAAIDTIKDRNAEYTIVVLRDLGSNTKPVTFKLPTYSAGITVVGVDDGTGSYKTINYSNRIDLKTPTTLRNLSLSGFAVKKSVGVETPYDIAAGGNNLTIDNVEGKVKSVTGNNKNKLTIENAGPEFTGNIGSFAEVALILDDTVNVAGTFGAGKLVFGDDGRLDVKGAVTVTDIENNSGTLVVYKNPTNKKTNLTVKGLITNNALEKLDVVVGLAPNESEDDLRLVKDSRNVNKVILSDTKALLKLEKAALDTISVKTAVPDSDGNYIESAQAFDSDGIVKANKAVYICDDDVADYNVLIKYNDGAAHEYRMLDFAQAIKEIEAITNPLGAYEILADGISDTDLTGDNNVVSSLKLPAGGKLASLRIDMNDGKLDFTGAIANTGKLIIENTILNPVAISRGVVIPADTSISSTATNVKINGVNKSHQGLILHNVSLSNNDINAKGLITKISGTNKVTDMIIDSSSLTIREGISNIGSLTLKDADIVTGKTSNIPKLVIKDVSGVEETPVSGSSWKMFGTTTIGSVECNNRGAYVAGKLGKNDVPVLTVTGKVTGVLPVSLLADDATIANPVCVDKYVKISETDSARALKNQNLLISKNENADHFVPVVPGSDYDISEWVTYKDIKSYVKAAPKSELKVRIDQYYDDADVFSSTYATCLYDAVKIIDTMNDRNANYVINLSGNNRTGALAADGEPAIAGFITPSKAKLVIFRGDPDYAEENQNKDFGPGPDGEFDDDYVGNYRLGNNCGATLLYTGSISTNCNIAFENIAFEEVLYNAKTKVITGKDTISLSVKNYDVSFDNDCKSIRMSASTEANMGESALYYDLIFSSIKAGSYGTATPGLSLDGYVYCAGNIQLSNLTLNNDTCLYSDGEVNVSGTTYVCQDIPEAEAELCSGLGKKQTLNNIVGDADTILNLMYFYEKKETFVYSKGAKTTLTVSGNVETVGEGEPITINLRPYIMNRYNIGYGDYLDYGYATLKNMENLALWNNAASYYPGSCIANIPKASAGCFHPQYGQIITNSQGVSSGTSAYQDTTSILDWKNIEGETGSRGESYSKYITLKWNKGLYISKEFDGNMITVKGYTDSEYSEPVYESQYMTLKDALLDINNLGRADRYYTIDVSRVVDAEIPSISGIKAKEIRYLGDDETTILYFAKNTYNLGCNTVLEKIQLYGGGGKKYTDGRKYDTEMEYSISLGKYSLTELNPANYLYDGQSWGQQSGKRKSITGSSGSTYICRYDDDFNVYSSRGYLDLPAKNIRGVTNLVIENNMTGEEHVELPINIPSSLSVNNLTVSGTKLSVNNLTVSKNMTLDNAIVNVGTSVNDGIVKLNDVTVSGEAKLNTKLSSRQMPRLTISGNVIPENQSDKLTISVKQSDNTGYVTLYDGLQIMNAPKLSTAYIKLVDDMNPEEGYLLYRNNKNVFYTDNPGKIEAKLKYDDYEADYLYLTDALKDIDSFRLYKDPSAKNKEYKDYEVILTKDVPLYGVRGSVSLPSYVSELTLNGNGYRLGEELPYGASLASKSNLVIKNVDFATPMKLTGVSKYSLTLESGEINCDSISGFGQVNLNTGTQMNVLGNANFTKLNMINRNSTGPNDNYTALIIGKSLRSSCIYIDTDAAGSAALIKRSGSRINLTGEKVKLDGTYITRSIDNTASDNSSGRLHIIADGSTSVSDVILTDNYLTDSIKKISLYRESISTPISFYTNGKDLLAGR